MDGFKAFEGSFKEQKASELIASGADFLGFGAFGAILGTAVGIMEKYGEAIGKVVRVGVGLGETMSQLRDASSEIGVTFDQFAAIIATNGEMLRTLGSNTGEGATAASRLTAKFQELTQAQGFYGMANDEMLQLLLEEAEARRLTIGQLQFDRMGLDGLAESVARNIKENTAMARLTGQDVRDRMAARREMENNVIVQSYLQSLGDSAEYAREKMGQFSATLAVAPSGNQIAQDMLEAIGAQQDYIARNPELYSLLGEPLRELFEFAKTNIRNDTMSAAEFDANILSMTSRLGDNLDASMETNLRARAYYDESARDVLAFATQLREYGSTDEILAARAASVAIIEQETQNPLAVAGINAATNRAVTELNDTAIDIAEGLMRTAEIFMPGEQGAGNTLVNSLIGLSKSIGLISGNISQYQRLINRHLELFMSTENVTPDQPAGEVTGEFPANTDPYAPAHEGGTAQPISFTPDDFRNAVIQAFMEVIANGGLPVDVRNWGQMPRPSPYSSA